MESKKLIKVVRIFFILFNISCITDIVWLFISLSPHPFKLVWFGKSLINNVYVLDVPWGLMVVTIVLFTLGSRYIYQRIVDRILQNS